MNLFSYGNVIPDRLKSMKKLREEVETPEPDPIVEDTPPEEEPIDEAPPEDTTEDTTDTTMDETEDMGDTGTDSSMDTGMDSEFGNEDPVEEEPTEIIKKKRDMLIDEKLNELYKTYNEFKEYFDGLDFDFNDNEILKPSFVKLNDMLMILDKYIKENKNDLFPVKMKNLYLFRTSLILIKNEIDSLIVEYSITV